MSSAVKAPREKITVTAQLGPQHAFLSSEADICVYGGAAGGGKTYGLLLDPLRHYNNALFGGVIFRRTSVQIKIEGGLWDTSMGLYTLLNGKPREHFLEWKFPSGMSMSFANIEHEADVYNYQGAQIPWLGFDELTHFTESQFFYMMTRNRSTSGAKPKIRATCNPDPDSWVRRFIDWFIGEDGFPIKERMGKLRWFIRINDQMIWANSAEEIYLQYGRDPEIQPKSVTFIAAKLEDNQVLMKKDPAYLGNLLAQDRVTRARLREGNWNIRASAGTLFKEEWFPIVESIPGGWIDICRFWDRAATKPHEQNKDPDWTRGLKLYKYGDGTFVVGDLKSARDTPGQIENLIKNTATHDTTSTKIRVQQDPGSAGVSEAEHFVKMLAGYNVDAIPFSKDKVTRAKGVSAQAEWGNIKVLRAPWNKEFFAELENFSEDLSGHDDIVDTLSGAFNELCGGVSLADVI